MHLPSLPFMWLRWNSMVVGCTNSTHVSAGTQRMIHVNLTVNFSTRTIITAVSLIAPLCSSPRRVFAGMPGSWSGTLNVFYFYVLAAPRIIWLVVKAWCVSCSTHCVNLYCFFARRCNLFVDKGGPLCQCFRVSPHTKEYIFFSLWFHFVIKSPLHILLFSCSIQCFLIWILCIFVSRQPYGVHRNWSYILVIFFVFKLLKSSIIFIFSENACM